MAFNSDTYYANKNSRQAWAYLAEARDIKRRVEAGEAYPWEASRVETCARLARMCMRSSLTYRRIAAIDAEFKRRHRR